MKVLLLHAALAGGLLLASSADAAPRCDGAASLSPAGQRACMVGAASKDEAFDWLDVDLTIRHAGAGDLRCSFGLAHWYEVTVGPEENGEPLKVRLIARARTGEVAMVNGVGARMRLERIWCGTSATPQQDWQAISIDALRAAPAAAEMDCTSKTGASACVLKAR